MDVHLGPGVLLPGSMAHNGTGGDGQQNAEHRRFHCRTYKNKNKKTKPLAQVTGHSHNKNCTIYITVHEQNYRMDATMSTGAWRDARSFRNHKQQKLSLRAALFAPWRKKQISHLRRAQQRRSQTPNDNWRAPSRRPCQLSPPPATPAPRTCNGQQHSYISNSRVESVDMIKDSIDVLSCYCI